MAETSSKVMVIHVEVEQPAGQIDRAAAQRAVIFGRRLTPRYDYAGAKLTIYDSIACEVLRISCESSCRAHRAKSREAQEVSNAGRVYRGETVVQLWRAQGDLRGNRGTFPGRANRTAAGRPPSAFLLARCLGHL